MPGGKLYSFRGISHTSYLCMFTVKAGRDSMKFVEYNDLVTYCIY